ncbi:hypothetical protein LINGRAHAP2_LOCUS21751 [Linum grandiflorum]
MRRGRGKGKKLTVRNHDDGGSGEEEEEEEKIPAQKRRGRPQKLLKDDIDYEQVEKIEDDGKGLAENVKKRRRSSQQAKEKPDLVKEEANKGVPKSTSTDDGSTKINGFRQNGSRRKSKPRRAAEAGVECRRPGLMI